MTTVNSGYVLATFQRGNGRAAYIAPGRTGRFLACHSDEGNFAHLSPSGVP
jgi:hypothetical protein